MWISLALALLALQINQKLALLLLLIAMIWGTDIAVLGWQADLFLGLQALLAMLYQLCRPWRNRRLTLELLLVLSALALMMHLVPGFYNRKIIDGLQVGPLSAPASFWFNFDKGVVPFVLLACMPSLFVTRQRTAACAWQWLLLGLAVPLLLLLAVLVGGLRPEWHFPSWIGAFMLANLFFVSLAEEALFRGYLQQRLTGLMPPQAALAIAALAFGLAHAAGGPLLVLFATLAGVIYGLAWRWSGRLWVATAFHFALNLCHLLFFTWPVLLRQ